MNKINLNIMIEKWKKISKDKADQIQKRSDRKLRIKVKKKLIVKKIEDKYDEL